MTNEEPQQGDPKGVIEGKEVLRRTLSGGRWYFINIISQRVLSLGTFLIIARLLAPADFGIITLAMIYPTLIDSLTAIAFDAAVVPLPDGEEKQYLDAIWTFSILRGTFISLIIFLLAPVFARYFHAEQNILLFQLSALPFLLQGFANVGQIYFSRNLEFGKFYVRDLVNQLTISLGSIIGALMLHSYWALYISNTLAMLFVVISTYLLSGYRPRLDLSLLKLRPLMNYGIWVYGQEMLNQIGTFIENMLMGRFTSVATIGLYGKAKGVAGLISTTITSALGKVSFSSYARIQGSPAYIHEGYHKTVEFISSIVLPFVLVILVAGDRIIGILLGNQWLPMTPALKVLIIPVTLEVLSGGIARSMFNALNKPRLHFNLNVVYVLSNSLMLFVLVPRFGIMGAAYALLVSSVISNGYAFMLTYRLIAPNLRRLSSTFGIVLLSLAPFIPLVPFLRHLPFAQTSLGFIALVTTCALVYVLFLFAFERMFHKGPFSTLELIARSFLRIKSGEKTA